MFCIIYDIMCSPGQGLSEDSSLECTINSPCESKYIQNLYLPNFLHLRNGPTPGPISIYKVNLESADPFGNVAVV